MEEKDGLHSVIPDIAAAAAARCGNCLLSEIIISQLTLASKIWSLSIKYGISMSTECE